MLPATRRGLGFGGRVVRVSRTWSLESVTVPRIYEDAPTELDSASVESWIAVALGEMPAYAPAIVSYFADVDVDVPHASAPKIEG